jgi:hypothetical protein
MLFEVILLTPFIPQLPDLLPAPGAWRPFPTISERAGWLALPAEVRKALIQRGEAALDYAWPMLPASLFLEFARMGNRSNYERLHFDRRHTLAALVMAECAESQGRFLDDIVNGIWAICEETYWGVPAHIGAQKAGSGLPDAAEPTVDLFAAETAALLAWTDYLLGARLDIVSLLVRPRIRLEVQRRILQPCLQRDDFWWMSFDSGGHGINNWNPWVNSNWLAAALLLEEDSPRRTAAVAKILRSLDLFIATYGEMGGCDEGPGYWGRAAASLFDCLELLHSATGGKLSVYDQAKIQNMGRFIYRTHIAGDYYVNFADASAVNHPPAGLVFRYGQRIADPKMMGFGAWLAVQAGPAQWTHQEGLFRQLGALFSLPELRATPPAPSMPAAVWFDDIQVLVARDHPGDDSGLFLAAKGGHNAESHNHNDIGSVIVYAAGLPAIVDAGVETYTRKTFSPQRYAIWTMQSAYHSLLPTLVNEAGEFMQVPGREFAAREVLCELDAEQASLALDIAPAYPVEAGITHWQRVIRLGRGAGVTVQDDYELARPTDRIELSLLTPSQLVLAAPGVVELQPLSFGVERRSAALRFTYPVALFTVRLEEVPITDERLGGVWGTRLHRIVFTAANPPLAGQWRFEFTG